MSGRCCVCDGQIRNGRCQLCGMPDKSDVKLYHLNEDRQDHLRHATAKERQILKEKSTPLGDDPTANHRMTYKAVKKEAVIPNKPRTSNVGNAGKVKKNGSCGILLWIFVLIMLGLNFMDGFFNFFN